MKKKHDIDVFISYSSKDQKVADNIVSTLEDYGVKCWIASRDIPQGTFWADAIDQAISRAKIFLIVVGENSISSLQVPKELGLAITSCETIIPYRIDKSELKGAFRYYLSDCQWFNGQAKNQADMENLANSVCEILGKEPVKKSAADGGESDAHRVNSESKKNKLMIAGGVAIALLVCVVIVLMIALQSGKNKGDLQAGGLVAVSDGDVTEPEDDRDYGFTPVLLSAPEIGTVYDFMFAVDVIKGRLNQYFGEGNYEMELVENNTRIALNLPTKDLTDCPMKTYGLSYFFRPRELYLAKKGFSLKDSDSYVCIPRDEIKKVELRTGNVPEWDVSKYPELGETYEYLEIYLGENGAKTAKELFYEADELVLVQDISSTPYYYYEYVQLLDGGERLLVLDTFGSHRLNELTKYAYENETFKNNFLGGYDQPVFWDISDFGESQVMVEKLTGPIIQAIYEVDSQYSASEFSAVEFRARLQEQLDAIGLPYALGRLASDESSVVLGVDASKVPESFLKWLPVSSSYQFVCGKQTLYPLDGGMKLHQQQVNGKTVFAVEFQQTEYLQKQVEELKMNAESAPVLLQINREPCFVGHFDENGNLFLDESVFEKKSETVGFSEDMKYVVDYLEQQTNQAYKNSGIYVFKEAVYKHEVATDIMGSDNYSFKLKPCYYADELEEEQRNLEELLSNFGGCSINYSKGNLFVVLKKDGMFTEEEVVAAYEAIYPLKLDQKYRYFVSSANLCFYTDGKEGMRLATKSGGDGYILSAVYTDLYREVRDAAGKTIVEKYPKIDYQNFN